MLDDFKRALARVQRDYEFYIECQTSPAAALAGYDLSPAERSALSDPARLADVFRGGIGLARLRITISGRHDWVNRTRPTKRKMEAVDRDAAIATQVEAIKKSSAGKERTGAVLRLMELVG